MIACSGNVAKNGRHTRSSKTTCYGKMKIRAYESRDQEGVVRLWKDCGLVVSHNNPFRDIERKLKVNPEWFLVGELSGEIVASCPIGAAKGNR